MSSNPDGLHLPDGFTVGQMHIALRTHGASQHEVLQCLGMMCVLPGAGDRDTRVLCETYPGRVHACIAFLGRHAPHLLAITSSPPAAPARDAQTAQPTAAPAPTRAPVPASATTPDATPEAMPTFTLLEATEPERLSKRFWRASDGRLEKLPGGMLVAGRAKRATCSLATLARAISETHPGFAIILGVPKNGAAVARVAREHEATGEARRADPTLIARTKADFGYPKGAGLLLVDTDVPTGAAPFTRAEVGRQLAALCPAIDAAPRMIYDSASGWVYTTEGQLLIGQRGLHTFIVIQDASHAAEAAKVLHLRAFAQGQARLEVGKAGQLLKRSIVDTAAAASPERLVFSFGADCGTGLEQRRPPPEVFNAHAAALDTRKHLKLTKTLEAQAQAAFERMAADPALLAAQARVRNGYVAERGNEMVRRINAVRERKGLPALSEDQQQQVQDRVGKQLAHTFASMPARLGAAASADLGGLHVIHLQHGEPVTVDEILADPGRFDGQHCHDPLEPDYGGNDPRIGTIHSKASGGGRTNIYSHAHGGCVFRLHPSAQAAFDELPVEGTMAATSNHPAQPAGPETAFVQVSPALASQPCAIHPLSDISDLANAGRLRELAAGDIIHVKGLGLLVYQPNMGVWVADEGEAKKLAQRLSRAIDKERMEIEQQLQAATDRGVMEQLRKKVERLAKAAITAESARNIRAAYELLSAQVSTRVEFDADPMLLNVRNGTLDLRSMELRPHRREDYLTQQAAVAYDPAAQAPRWAQFVEEICLGDKGLADYMQTVAGYWLTGHIGEKTLWVQYGTGDNGKNTFNDRIIEMMGTYAGVMAPSALGIGKLGDSGEEKAAAKLFGKRLMVAGEPAAGLRLNEAFVKRMTGDEMLSMKKLYKDEFDGRNQVKLAIATNHKPEIAGNDPATWARIALLPFLAHYPKDDPRRDSQLAEKLKAELPGILNWALRGLERWHAQGQRLIPSAAVRVATEEYKRDEDRLGEFLDERTEPAPAAVVPFADLYAHYRAWAGDAGYGSLSKKKFSMRVEDALTARGARKERDARNNVILLGLQLLGRMGLP